MLLRAGHRSFRFWPARAKFSLPLFLRPKSSVCLRPGIRATMPGSLISGCENSFQTSSVRFGRSPPRDAKRNASRRSNAAAANAAAGQTGDVGSQFYSEWRQNGAPFRIKLRTLTLLKWLYNSNSITSGRTLHALQEGSGRTGGYPCDVVF
jgi:hypothetical protein